MTFWTGLGWAMAIVMLLAFWAFVIYMCAIGVSFMWPKVPGYINARVKHLCPQCGMAKQLGHWPGCDYWTGENLDLLIFKDYEQNGD
jgi:hypothetical protein